MDWTAFIILIILIIALILAILLPGPSPEWQDLHGEEYLKWRQNKK